MQNLGLKLTALAWLSLILFSSTSIGGTWAEASFRAVASRFLSGLHIGEPSYAMANFAAEKCFHLAAFAVFAMLIWMVVPDVPWKLYAILAVGIIVGTTSELLQSFFPGRDPAMRDVVINCIGTIVGATLSLAFSRKANRMTS
jgi:glycopeptide antibiotics resistance protein